MSKQLQKPAPRHDSRAMRFYLSILCFLLVAIAGHSVFAQQTRALPSAEKIVDNYLKAIGGKKRVAAIRDATYEWSIQLGDQSQGVATVQFKAPGSVRSELTIGNGKNMSAANPRSAWVQGLDGEPRTLTGPDAAAAKLQAALDVSHLLDYKKANVLARVLALHDSPSGPVYIVEFSSRAGARVKYQFSAETKLVVCIQDDARKTITWLDEYRPEGNILEPHVLRLTQNDSGALTFKLQHVSYNSGIAAAVFDPPRATEALDVANLLREVSRNQDAVEKRFTEYSFLQKATEREIDGKGVVKKETVKVFEVFPLPNREPIMKLISENGVALSGERAAKEDKRVQEEFLKAERDKDKDAQKVEAQRAERRRKSGKDDDSEVEISTFLLICEFVSPRHERFQDRDAVVFDFRAQPGYKPRTRQESLISKLVGVVWIDPVDKQVMRLEARLADGFKVGGGLVMSLKPGAALVMEQTRMNEGIWMPRFMQINLSVRVLLFGNDINQTVEWSEYKHFSADVDSYKLGAPKTEEPAVKKP